MTEFKISLFYDCPKCKARNFLDPYSYLGLFRQFQMRRL